MAMALAAVSGAIRADILKRFWSVMGADETWVDDFCVDVVLFLFQVQAFGEVDEGGFGGAVRLPARQAAVESTIYFPNLMFSFILVPTWRHYTGQRCHSRA